MTEFTWLCVIVLGFAALVLWISCPVDFQGQVLRRQVMSDEEMTRKINSTDLWWTMDVNALIASRKAAENV